MENIWIIYMRNIYVGFKCCVGSCEYFVSGPINQGLKICTSTHSFAFGLQGKASQGSEHFNMGQKSKLVVVE